MPLLSPFQMPTLITVSRARRMGLVLVIALLGGSGAALACVQPPAGAAGGTMPREAVPCGGGWLPELEPPRPIRMVAPLATMPIELSLLKVRTTVAGQHAQTRIELVLKNPNPTVLEGELEFPLTTSQTVTGFALDMDGELRPAVPVEKAKGRQVFEDIARRRVDPALLEATAGNHHKLRVYPLPAQGTRRVVLELTETLVRSTAASGAAAGSNPQQMGRWWLPLQYGGPLRQVDVQVRLPHTQAAQVQAQAGARNLSVKQEVNGDAVVTLSASDGQAPPWLGLQLATAPAGREPVPAVVTGTYKGDTYFYAEVPVPDVQAPRARPRTLGLIWDASGSASQRDQTRELAVLDAYLRSLGDVRVVLRVVRNEAGADQTFMVKDGHWAALREHLLKLPNDGATSLGAMVPPPSADMTLVFTDGLGNFGAGRLPRSPHPVMALVSSPAANTDALRDWSQASGGLTIDLLSVASAAQAVQTLSQQPIRLLGLQADAAAELQHASVYPDSGWLAIAGKLTQPQASVTLQLALPNAGVQTLTLPVAHTVTPTPEIKDGPDLAAILWARMRLSRLMADADVNQASVRRLGLHFGMATAQTSLIVLDSVADYVRHGIEPPASLLAAYQQGMLNKQRQETTAQATQLERVGRLFEARVKWWNTDFPKDTPSRDADSLMLSASAGRRNAGMPVPVNSPAPAMAAPAPAAAAPAMRVAPSASAANTASAAQVQNTGTIQLKRFNPDAAYMQRVRQAAAEDLYAIYLDERPGYAQSTSFFLDMADALFDRGQSRLALRVLSNLAEMNLENRHVLRILAYRLIQADQTPLALPVLRKVRDLSPDEPQSWRDLGLALAQDGQYQAAVDALWQVVSRPWHGRFPGVELIALTELNAVVARHAASTEKLPPLDLGMIDSKLLQHLPLDLRAVLTWDADNTDIDLWVSDPNGEATYYARPLSYQGGKMSADFVGGYGPEEFSLKSAKPGTYTVQAHFYGHRQQVVSSATTLMLRLTLGFGTPAQMDKTVVLRLKGQNDKVMVGTFDIPAKAKAKQ